MKRSLVPLLLIPLLAGCESTPVPAEGQVEAALSAACSVEGCVQRPGPLSLEGQRTVLDAIRAAGPIEGRSDLRRVQLVRGQEPAFVITIDLKVMLETGDSSYNVLLKPGDVLHVPELPQPPTGRPPA